MRLRLMEVEGTPEEIRRLDIEHLLGRAKTAGVDRAELLSLDAGDDSGLAQPDQIACILEAETPAGHSRELLMTFIDTVRSWGDVDIVPSWKPNDARRVSYLRVHRYPRTMGAFVYIFPARLRLNFRLEKSRCKGKTYAESRKVKSDSAYQVTLLLNRQECLSEALELARHAFDEVCRAPASS